MDTIDQLLGLHRASADLTLGNMVARTIVVFTVGLLTLRFGARRSMGRNASFDVLLFVIWGSVLSRGINGQAPFYPTLGTSVLLVLLHEGLSMLSARVHFFSVLTKGSPFVLVKNGSVDRRAMARACISDDDLEEGLRLFGNVARPEDVKEARLERNGQISVVRKS